MSKDEVDKARAHFSSLGISMSPKDVTNVINVVRNGHEECLNPFILTSVLIVRFGIPPL